MKYKEGDILINKYNNKIKILGICGLVHFISLKDNFTTCSSNGFTKEELDELGFTLVNESEKVLTMNEVAKLAGVPVDKLKIVKE